MDSAYSDGIFHVNIPGYYLITVNILATKDAGFWITSNNRNIVSAVVYYNGNDNGLHTASASAFVHMSVGNKVSVKGFRIDKVDSTSSMTIVKI